MSTPYSIEERYGKQIKKLIGPSLLPPLGMAYIAAVLEKNNQVKILDTNIYDMNIDNIINYLSKNKFDMIGISVQTPMYKNFQELIKKIRPVIGKTILVAGGPHPTIFPEDIIKENPEIDYAVYGEGEVVFPDLVKTLKLKKDVSKVKGIAYRKNGRVLKTKKPDFIKNLDNIPMPARHLLPMEKYIPAPSSYRKLPVFHMITSRGCPFRCVYCSSSQMLGRTFRQHSVGRVIKEIEFLIKKYKVKEIFFWDDLFTYNRKWVMDFCKEMIKRKLNKKIEWSCQSRVDIDFNMLKKMREAGCWQIHFGVESGSQRLLDIIKKGITLEQARATIKWARKANIITRAYFMLGLPTETRKESLQTIEFAKEIDPDYAKFSILTPYPGTELYNTFKKEGEISTNAWEYYKTMGGFGGSERPYIPKGRTSEELNELHKKAFKDFYLRPKIILRFLWHAITNPSELKLYIRGALTVLKL